MISRKLAGFTLLVFSFVFLTGIAFGQKDFAEISNQGTGVQWNVNAQYKSLTLTVSAPNGEYFRQVFPSGMTPVFETRYGDGSYKYEITLTPILAPGVEKMLVQARKDGTEEAVAADLRRRGLLPEPMISSGTFKVVGGQIITANDLAAEPDSIKTRNGDTPSETKSVPKANAGDIPPENVQVINDDLVVLGSECVGVDCTTSPSFGFDTLRLSENNLRINFQDTSNSASFPTSDWRIVANDTSNGGASYLAFEDTDAGTQPFRVEAGAGNAALWVTDNGGNVGMGTTTPVVELQITDGDSPTMRLEQNGASGFTPQTWDLAGNEANFFVRDVTNGSTLPFKIRPGANNDSLVISNTSNVGIGVGTNPSQKLEVGGNVQVSNNGSLIIESGSTGGITFADGTVQTTAGGGGGGGGEVNTATNVGAGQGVFKQKIGANLQFKSLTAGTNVTVAASGADEIQISAASPLGPSYATTIFGGSGTLMPGGTATPTFNANKYSATTTGGFAVMTYNIPTNPNLVDPAGTNTVFRIRYRDSDGAGAGASVTVTNVTINANSGNRTTYPIFTSTNATTTEQTVDVCMPATFFNFSSLANHLNIVLFSGAGTSAEVVFVQMYKSTTCP